MEFPEKCQSCNLESNSLELYIPCNIEKKEFPVRNNTQTHSYVECLFFSTSNDNKLINKLLFNPITKEFNLCYET